MRPIGRYGVPLVVLLGSVIILPAPAFAGWQSADVTAVNIQRVCKDGIKFEAGVREDVTQVGDYVNQAVVTDPPPSQRPVPPNSIVIRTEVRIPPVATPIPIHTDDGEDITLSHYKQFKLRFPKKLHVGRTVAVNVQDFADGSGFSVGTVEKCRLF
jgi:hypothetical protein